MFLGEDVEVEVDSALVERGVLKHGQEICPFGVDEGVGHHFFNHDGVELVKVVGYFSHNDNYKFVPLNQIDFFY